MEGLQEIIYPIFYVEFTISKDLTLADSTTIVVLRYDF